MPSPPHSINEDRSDQELARETRAGSLHAFDLLVDRHHVRVFRFLLQRNGNLQDAEDLTQLVFLKAFRKIHQYNPKYQFETWLFAIARRQAIALYRREAKRNPLLDLSQECVEETPASNLEAAEKRQQVWQCARSVLTEDMFQAIWLRYQEDLPVREIAKILGKTAVHVRVLLHRARGILADQLTGLVTAEVELSISMPAQPPRFISNYS